MTAAVRRAVVTGASGFVGRAVVARLAVDGWQVTGLMRTAREVPGLTRPVQVPALERSASFTSAFDGAELVVHLAARVHVMRESAADPLAEFRRVNVDGTAAVLDASVKAGVARVITASTVKVFGPVLDRPFRIEDPVRPDDPYGQSKWEAEQLHHALGDRGPHWTVLRPPLVYGPGVGGNFRRLLQLARLSRRLPLPLGGIRNQRSMIGVTNLADAIAWLSSVDAARQQTLLISDGEDTSTPELLTALARQMNGYARLFPLPSALINAAARLVGLVPEAERLLGSLQVDSTPLRHTLGWRPPKSLEEGLADTVRAWTLRA